MLKSCLFESVIIMLVSSAKSTILLSLLINVGKSLMEIRKNRGPRIEPCGKPHLIIFHLEELLLLVVLSRATFWYLSVK